MPKVGGKSFPYSVKGKAKAKAFAKKTGQHMMSKKEMDKKHKSMHK